MIVEQKKNVEKNRNVDTFLWDKMDQKKSITENPVDEGRKQSF